MGFCSWSIPNTSIRRIPVARSRLCRNTAHAAMNTIARDGILFLVNPEYQHQADTCGQVEAVQKHRTRGNEHECARWDSVPGQSRIPASGGYLWPGRGCAETPHTRQ